MAGTIVADTLQDGAGNSTAMDNAIYGSAKAWVKWTGTGGATINASYNVSSITRTGTGQFTISMTNAMPDANYSIVGMSGVSSSYQAGMMNNDIRLGSNTSSVFYISFNNYSGSAYTDPQYGNVAVFR